MKKEFKLTAVFVGLAAVFSLSGAQAGNIQFNGQVTTQTCETDIFGVQNPTIYLDSIASTALPAGAVAGYSEFTITATGCAVDPTNPQIFTVSFQADGMVVDGNIQNTATTGASNANLKLSNTPDNTGHITLNGNLLTAAQPLTLAANQTATNQKYYVAYAAPTSVAATVGAVKGAVNYVVRYP